MSGVRMKAVPIPKGTVVSISILGSNYKKEVWGEDAFEFKPERWMTDRVGGIGKNGVRYPGIYSNM